MRPGQKFSAKTKAAAALELRRRKFRAFCAQFRDDPVEYVRQVRGERPTADQADAMRRIARGRRVVWKAHHAQGKTKTAAWVANWWFDCFERSIVYITGPTWESALNLTFKEIKQDRRAGSRARDWENPREMLWDGELPGRILETGKVLDEIKGAEGYHYIKAINAEKGESFQGEHAAPILIIMEEAVGVPAFIWEAAEGLMTHPDCKLLAVGNPTDQANNFGEACDEGSEFDVITGCAFDHDNIKAELECQPPPVPLAVRLIWLYEMLRRECELTQPADPDGFEYWSTPTLSACLAGLPISRNPDAVRWWYKPNGQFEGRALGRFPGQAFEQVIPRKWVENLPVIEPPASEIPEVGIDVARFGDDRTCIAVRQGPCLLMLQEIRHMDLTAITAAAVDAIRFAAEADGRNYQHKAIPVRVDVTGGLGAGPADELASRGYEVVGVNSSERSDETDTDGNLLYENMRSQLWFACRERARTRQLDFSRIGPDLRRQLVKELAVPKWKNLNSGLKQVERKSDIKKRLKWSPDLADAVNLAFAAEAEPLILTAGSLPDWDKPWGR